nr:Rrf2 family transcriptional regulator [Pseudorhodobacter aquimaris]
MQLDKFTDYALRVLVTLAVRAPDRVAAAEIARLYGLSANHLAKVATALVRTGFVNSERGRGGGLRLARPACGINIGAVLRSLKQTEPVAECFSSEGICLIAPACGLRAPLAEAQEAFFASLDRYTLADVTKSKAPLLALLTP